MPKDVGGAGATNGSPPQATAAWFREEFEKELGFSQLFLLLINNSCPIKRIDLVWAEDGPAQRVGLRQKLVCTEEALAGPCANLLGAKPISEPLFCNRMAACADSDKAAEVRVRQSGKGEAYPCPAGLIDIAVPVFADGLHIATLLSGQVRRELPTESQLEQLRLKLDADQGLNWSAVQESYWQVPIVTDADIQRALEILGLFAEYLGNTWSRLCNAIKGEQRRSRELHLARKEFAHIALEGGIADQATLHELMDTLGLKRYPNRVLVLQLESEDEHHAPTSSFDLAVTRALQSIEELCEAVPNGVCARLRHGEICVLYRDLPRSEANSSLQSQNLAKTLLQGVSRAADLRARVGVGSVKAGWHRLVDSYHEAAIALAASGSPIVWYNASLRSGDGLATLVGEICRELSEGRLQDAHAALAALPLRVEHTLRDLQAQRHFYAYALESLAYASRALLPDETSRGDRVPSRMDEIGSATSAFALHEEFSQQAEAILDAVRRVFSGKREKMTERACRLMHKELSDPATAGKVSISRVASALGISNGYFSRIFKREMGMTFERYLMAARVEASKRALLEPLNSVSAVAEQIGFVDPAYYARVFRKIAGCSPTQYRTTPALYPFRRSAQQAS